ncbi:Cytoskeleton protein RodZ [Thalassocella blandensis]|nr:Cytoskeleton protein RodZ [Thalassocella blandensis]
MTDTKPDETLSQNAIEGTSWSTLRESKGISLEEIAQQTNIAMRKLEALEQKDFESLGTETFALGYIRRYAKILNVDPQIFIETYKASRPEGDESEIPAGKIPGRESFSMSEKPRKIPLAAISAIIFVVWIGVMWLLPGDEAPESSKPAAPEALEQQPVAQSDDATVPTPVVAPVVTTVVSVEKKPESLEQSQVLEQESETETAGAPEIVENNPLAADAGSAISSNTVTAGTSEVSQAPVSNDPLSESSAGEDVIVMAFTDDCWVEIKDAQGTVIFAQLQTKEDNLQIFGQAPFKVMLGNARAATVSLNGALVSTAPSGSQKTLRLTLSN